MQAECDKEGALESSGGSDQEEQNEASRENRQSWTPIRAEHVTKVAAHLIMDFS